MVLPTTASLTEPNAAAPEQVSKRERKATNSVRKKSIQGALVQGKQKAKTRADGKCGISLLPKGHDPLRQNLLGVYRENGVPKASGGFKAVEAGAATAIWCVTSPQLRTKAGIL